MQKELKLKTNLATSYRGDNYWVPLPGPQTLAVALSNDKRYREILFGGARGPGKTDASIAILGNRFKDPRAKQLVIRRNAEDLSDFEDRASLAYKSMGAKLRRKPMTISGKGTGRILGGHLKDDDAYSKYQGHEYCRINIEELTQTTLRKLVARVARRVAIDHSRIQKKPVQQSTSVGVNEMKKLTLEKQVRHVLEMDEQSRNSDIRLTQVIWWTYYRKDLLQTKGGVYVKIDKLFELPREDNVKRIRAKIQNVHHEFLPTSPEVAKKRGWEIDEWRQYLGYPTGDTL